MSSALIGKCNASVLKTERDAVHRADTETAYTVVPSRPKPLGTVSCSRTIVSRPGSSCCRVCERVRIDQSQEVSEFGVRNSVSQKISRDSELVVPSDRKSFWKPRDSPIKSCSSSEISGQNSVDRTLDSYSNRVILCGNQQVNHCA